MFQTHYHALPYPKTKENRTLTKDKIEPQHRCQSDQSDLISFGQLAPEKQLLLLPWPVAFCLPFTKFELNQTQLSGFGLIKFD